MIVTDKLKALTKKNTLRHQSSNNLGRVTYLDRQRKSRQIRKSLTSFLELLLAYGMPTIMTFDPYKSQPDIEEFNMLLVEDPRVRCVYGKLFPKHGISTRLVSSPKDLVISSHSGRMEPKDTATPIDPSDINCILVPGSVFCKHTMAMIGWSGIGPDHYNKLLLRLDPSTVRLGVCFEDQILKGIPVESRDVKMDGVLTEKAMYGMTP